MKLFKYQISPEAVADLNKIWLYTFETWSLQQADRYYNLLIEEIGNICKIPYSGKLYDHVRKGYRASKVKSHIIFYKINNDVVEIIRILHQRMDIENILNK